MDLGLKDKVAIVTGGTGAIGRAIAQRLLTEGAKVVISGRSQEKLDQAIKSLKDLGSIQGVLAHVDRSEDVQQLVQTTVNQHGRVDIVVSNAGTHVRGSLQEVTPQAVLAHFQTKIIGPWMPAQSVEKHMREQGGRFIVIIGQAGKVPGRNVLASSVVNAAQHAFVKSLSDDLGRHGILVNAVCPSRIVSPLTKHLTLDEEEHLGRSLEQQQHRWGATVPLGRWGNPEDVADAVTFLASDRAKYMCGANIDVDGGHQRMIL